MFKWADLNTKKAKHREAVINFIIIHHSMYEETSYGWLWSRYSVNICQRKDKLPVSSAVDGRVIDTENVFKKQFINGQPQAEAEYSEQKDV